jgi:hypothetical protein
MRDTAELSDSLNALRKTVFSDSDVANMFVPACQGCTRQ